MIRGLLVLIHISSSASSILSDSGILVQNFTVSLVIKNDAFRDLLSLNSSEQTEILIRHRSAGIGHGNNQKSVKHEKARV
jgi:hypothetical protein